eukprot:CAMPEP_0203662906 /NCGR_PEP_ID=MMETSP0090-20130426/699_1 /ASSEMBLY_ACC=CAM_ASM_001088 /TAXON_ID=426623 /ORGANISM="Chaetoceros affinis, Strain CCMP159" /LENGTH=419 /DNA_ID=CAMNT_0050525749 /DNA_START=78 /DNA_END=1338 /DNA_ORIENTATION=+
MYKYGKSLISSLTSRKSNNANESTNQNDNESSQRPAADLKVTGWSSSLLLSSSSPLSSTRRAPPSSSLSSSSECAGTKRSRHDGYETPMLIQNDEDNDSKSSSCKRKKTAGAYGQSSSLLLEMIPVEVLESHVVPFLTDGKDYYSLSLTCKVTKRMVGSMDILRNVDLAGDVETGVGSILHGVESPAVAVERLYRFAAAGNQQALYMIGMIAAYCHGDRIGVTILKQTARQGCLRSAYALGLILRDGNRVESEKYLNAAIEQNYLPACQELLSSQTVKDRFGDLDHTVLKKYFDPIGLNRLLGRCYLHSNGVRGVATSHCWNPCCGRWALKATQANAGQAPQLQSTSTCLPAMASHVEASLLRLTQRVRNRVEQRQQIQIHQQGEDGCEHGDDNSDGDDDDKEVMDLNEEEGVRSESRA